MAIEQAERELFGEALDPEERLFAGIIAAVGGIGHAVLLAAILTFVYVLAFVV